MRGLARIARVALIDAERPKAAPEASESKAAGSTSIIPNVRNLLVNRVQ